MTLDFLTFVAIIAMACATYATRLLGVMLAPYVKVRGASKAALDAVPPAILMAIIAPVVLATGIAETLASVVTVLVALRFALPVAIVSGVLSVVVLRLVF